MPEGSKKNQNKGKHDAKEQRKPRQPRHHGDKSEKKVDKKVEEPKAPTKPVFEDPGPEFYKNLKRETDEILKITEEANAKYKKKEIQSNWTKYEMPIDSYDEIEEQENLGADYEKLSQAPMSVGGHFQFRHEKSWDIETTPSLYDKYFEINMESLATALSTIPFYERNCIDKTMFSETDVVSMDNRSVKYKRKFYNDKSFKTPDLEAQDNILSAIKEGLRSTSQSEDKPDENRKDVSEDIILGNEDNIPNIKLDTKIIECQDHEISKTKESKISNLEVNPTAEIHQVDKLLKPVKLEKEIDDIDDLILGTTNQVTESKKMVDNNNHSKIEAKMKEVESDSRKQPSETTIPPKESKPVIESPEDLEKWLDDFLDG